MSDKVFIVFICIMASIFLNSPFYVLFYSVMEKIELTESGAIAMLCMCAVISVSLLAKMIYKTVTTNER